MKDVFTEEHLPEIMDLIASGDRLKLLIKFNLTIAQAMAIVIAHYYLIKTQRDASRLNECSLQGQIDFMKQQAEEAQKHPYWRQTNNITLPWQTLSYFGYLGNSKKC